MMPGATADGKRERGGFTLIELMFVVAMVGILASVAIPTFLGYARKAKTSEARGHLEKIYSAADMYFMETVGQRTDTVAQFPATVAVTPAVTCCLHPSHKCVPDQALWDHETWSALHFNVRDPHYYRYAFTSSGTGASAQFAALAHGDLDCDGVESTFEMRGVINASGEVQLTGSLRRVNERE